MEISVLYTAIAVVQLLLGNKAHLASDGGEWWISEGCHMNLTFLIGCPSWITIQNLNHMIIHKRY